MASIKPRVTRQAGPTNVPGESTSNRRKWVGFGCTGQTLLLGLPSPSLLGGKIPRPDLGALDKRGNWGVSPRRLTVFECTTIRKRGRGGTNW